MHNDGIVPMYQLMIITTESWPWARFQNKESTNIRLRVVHSKYQRRKEGKYVFYYDFVIMFSSMCSNFSCNWLFPKNSSTALHCYIGNKEHMHFYEKYISYNKNL